MKTLLMTLLAWIGFIIVGAILQGWLGTPNKKTGYKPEHRPSKHNGGLDYKDITRKPVQHDWLL